MPVGVAARSSVASALDTMTRELRAARAGRVRGVHQLRVSTRRLRAALELFEGALPRRIAGPLADELADLARTVGSVRDLDVLAEAIAKRGRKIGPALEPAVATILLHVRERRSAAYAVLAATLDAPRTRRLIERFALLARGRSGGAAPMATVAADLVRPLVTKVVRAGRDIDASASPGALHRLRIKAKRLRYALETLDGLGDAATRKLARKLTALQRLLGDQRDAANQRAWLADEMPAFVGDAEALVAVGAIGEALRRRSKRLLDEVPDAWARVDRPKLVAAALRELEREPAGTKKAA
jgi:CHAD domain-containing protein